MADLQETLAAQIACEDLAAIARTLDSLPAAITAKAIPVEEARELLTISLKQVIKCVTDLDGKPRAHLTAAATAERLASHSQLDDLLAEFVAIAKELGPALFRAHLAQRYSDKRLMRKLVRQAARRVRDTGRDPLGVVHDMIIEELQKERKQRENAAARPPVGEEHDET